MHPTLDRDVGVCDGGGEELPYGAEEEGVAGCYATALGESVFELFEDCVLEYWVYDEDESWEDASEEGCGSFFPE